jgi:CubicO group peptidase (beta-lactamase class C family)
MNLRGSLSLAVLTCFTLSTTAWTQNVNDTLHRMLTEAYPADEPGAAAIVVKDGEVLLRKGYGLANVELGVSIEPDMVFRIGSVTKQFTAAATLLLEQQGKLSVTDDIRKFLPEYPTGGRTVTIEHLLTHTSGIRSYTDMESFEKHAREDLSIDEMIELFSAEPFAFEPGEKYAYNNSGYFLLGAIIEKVSGESYETFLQQNIFDPLEMKQTYYGDPERIVARRAAGYERSPSGDDFHNASYLSMRLPYAAGSLLSSVNDLAKWDAALYSEEILDEDSLDKWWRPFSLEDGTSTHYAYGWSVNSYQGHPVVAHGGGINGFRCYVLRMPEDRLYVAVLTNRAADPAPSLVARKLAAAAIGNPIDTPEAIALSAETLERYTGVYRVDDLAKYHVALSSEDGALQLRRFGDEHPEGGRVRNPGPDEGLNRMAKTLFAASDAEFFMKDSLNRVRFESDADGGVTSLVHSSWDRTERAERTDEAYDDRSLILAAIDKLFAGMKALDADAMWSVVDRDARLVQTDTRDGQPWVRATPMSEFISGIAEYQGPELIEKAWDPEVRIEDNLATVWVSYAFYRGERFSHCGEDTFQLAKGPLGWKIIAIADTRRTEGCEER